MKVLVIQQRYGIGDMLIFLPYLKALSEKIGAKVSLLAKDSSRASDLFEGEDFLDEIIKLDSTNDGILGFIKLSTEIKKKKFDKIFIFNGSLRYKLLAIISGIREIYQYPLFTSKDVIFQTAKIFTENYVGKIISPQPSLNININKVKQAKIDYKIHNKSKNIVFGVSASGPTKRWGINNYIKLAEELSKFKNCKFFIVAGKYDNEIVEKILNSNVKNNCLSLENLSIRNILPIIKNCDLYIGNDTGFMHICSALGIKSIGIFVDSPALAYSGYSKNILAIVPEGDTIESTSHNTRGKDKISFEEVLKKSKIYLS
tara:strand:- start:2706 stop:3650 length:945 start_codon:yes stop_codon:yes gene_type:complete